MSESGETKITKAQFDALKAKFDAVAKAAKHEHPIGEFDNDKAKETKVAKVTAKIDVKEETEVNTEGKVMWVGPRIPLDSKDYPDMDSAVKDMRGKWDNSIEKMKKHQKKDVVID